MATMFKRVPNKDTATSSPATNNSDSKGGGFRRNSTFTRRPGRQKLTGLFANGTWHCDCGCDPRLPAEHFQVKKESANKGRWFYTCQNGEGRKCGFFLWDDDAKAREAAAVLSNPRTEPRSTPNKPSPPIDQALQTTQSSPESTSTLRHPSSALKRPFSDIDDHDSFPWSLSGQEEAELLNAPETPRKTVKFDTLATPATSAHRKLPWLEDSAHVLSVNSSKRTLSKTSALPQDPTPSHSRLAAVQQGALTPQVTPSPSRFRDPSADASSPRSTLTADVFDALSTASVTLPAELTSKLRDVLTRHELRNQGMTKGREITRLALKAREARIVELQATIATLEAEKDVDQARIRSLELEKEMLTKGQDFDAEL